MYVKKYTKTYGKRNKQKCIVSFMNGLYLN